MCKATFPVYLFIYLFINYVVKQIKCKTTIDVHILNYKNVRVND